MPGQPSLLLEATGPGDQVHLPPSILPGFLPSGVIAPRKPEDTTCPAGLSAKGIPSPTVHSPSCGPEPTPPLS